MMAFNMEKVVELLDGKKKLADLQQEALDDEASHIVIIEFLGARLSTCSSMVYLGGEECLVYYASVSGDSYLLSI